MKIAYLIMCHKNPKQVKKLIMQLNSKDVTFYIHIDKKCNEFQHLQMDNVFYVDEQDRVDVKWATISMVSATLVLIKKAFQNSQRYDYYFLISGQDFPIKNNNTIQETLEKNDGINFIEILNHEDPLYLRYRKRNDIYYPLWMFSRKSIVKFIKKLYIYLTGGYKKTYSCFKRKYPYLVDFEYGSQWWGLTFDALEWIYDYLINKNGLEIFFNSMTPDECVFQTAFMISPYKLKRKDKVEYIEWNDSLNNPKLLTKNDFNKLIMDKENLFARKFDIDLDFEIFQMLISVINEE